MLACVFVACSEEDDPVPEQRMLTYLFWTNLGDHTIERITLEKDRVVASEILYHADNGVEAPSAIVADAVAGMIYWTDFSTKQILRAPWDGNGSPEVLYTVPDPGDGPVELAFDPITKKLFWTQPFDDLILTAPADGGGEVDTLFSAAEGVDGAWGITLQVSEGYLYWIEYQDKELYRSRIGGAQPELLYAGGSGFLSPYGLAIREVTNELFITDNPVPGAGKPDRILKGSLDGTQKLEVVYDLQDGVNNAYNLAIDEATNGLYWHNQLASGSIYKGSPDGIQVPLVLVEGINIGQGLAVAIHKVQAGRPL